MLQFNCSGRLVRNPETKTSSKGTAYVQALLLVATSDGEQLVTLMAFDPDLQGMLASLKRGDSLSAMGSGSVRGYADKDGNPAAGVTVMVNRLMAMGEAKAPPRQRGNGQARPRAQDREDYTPTGQRELPPLDAYDDPIPF